MKRTITRLGLTLGAVLALIAPDGAVATTRELAAFQPMRLTFDQSVLNQLTYQTYRDPFDELQQRPYNLLFSNIGRHANLSPWPGQEGAYTRYLNALIGNNGTANVDNDADAVQGSLIRRETVSLAWGVSAAFLSGSDGSDDSSGSTAFSNNDDLSGFELRGGTAYQLSSRRVLGAGIRIAQGNREDATNSFEQGVGGALGSENFDQTFVSFDVGMRQFRSESSSWEVGATVGLGTAEQDELNENLDDTGAVTDRFVITNYEISDLSLGIQAAYNRLRTDSPGETEFRIGLERSKRENDNTDLSYSESAGVRTPVVTLIDQDALAATRVSLGVRSIFQAGQTEMFTGAQLDYRQLDGSTRIDASGVIVNEAIDDTEMRLGLTVGLRQPLLNDRVRFIVSGRADYLDGETMTRFDTGSDGDDFSLSIAQYAIGVEGVLANVTFDLAWLNGEEAVVVPVAVGLPQGSRRTVDLDRLVFSAAVSW